MSENRFLFQEVLIKKKYTNNEINLYHLFHKKTNVYPDNIIVFEEKFLIFFVKSRQYYQAKRNLKNIRRLLNSKKIILVRSETTLIKLLFSLFPDTYIHDIDLDINYLTDSGLITIKFLIYEDRAIAIGANGSYIRFVNRLFERYVILKEFSIPITIKCISSSLQMNY